MNITFDLATSADDAALRRILATNPVAGGVSVTYEREPSYFAGCATAGPFYQVPVARVEADGTVAGFALRAIRPRFVNGSVEQIGYLSHLRVDHRYRGHGLTAKGFSFLRQLHEDGRTSAYLATIIEGNTIAERLLTEQQSPAFPRFRPLDRIATLAIVVRPRKALSGSYTVVRGKALPLEQIVDFLQRQGAQRQFFPFYAAHDFRHSPITQDLCMDDFFLAVRGGEIVGTLALWDQKAYKQTVVQSYSGPIRYVRPVVNGIFQFLGAQPLPALGQSVRSLYASFVCVAAGAEDAFPLLLRAAVNEAARRRYAFVMLGFSERDPLLPLARRYAHIPYISRLYLAHWENEGNLYERLDGRVPYVEIATL